MRNVFSRMLIALAGFILSAGVATAAISINSATLNGASSVTVSPGATITANVNVTTSGSGSSNNWYSTGWRIATTAPGTLTCDTLPNFGSSGTNSQSFSITAPAAAGTYNVYFVAYNSNDCSSGNSTTYTMSNAVTVVVPPSVVSISRASTDPTAPATSVSWTVTFNTSVIGVDTGDFSLVQGGGVSGATITSVSGTGTTRTVTANTGSGAGTLGLNLVDNDTITGGGVALGGAGSNNGNFTGDAYTVVIPFSCTPPSNIPADVSVSCVCDTFGRASLNPSTIFGSDWIPTTSDGTGIVPSIVNSGYLRLTNNTGNNAKAATVPGIFPAAGNYISVEFRHYAYNGSNPGADGIAVTLSDYAQPAQPGAFGGSLGYAQKTGINGFAGGWIGVALDEYGNYPNATEGRIGGPGFIAQTVGVRGSASSGYRWLDGSGALSPVIDNRASTTPAPGYFYQVIVDARSDPTSTSVAVNRDTSGTGTSYTSLISIPNVYQAATNQGFVQAPVPGNWQISFTGSTGGSTNIHEIGSLRICAQTVWPPSGGVASGFNAVDEAYGTPPSVTVQSYLTGHIYTKLMGVPFKLNVAAIYNNQIQTAYVVSGSKYVQLKLVDNSDGACIIDSSQANYCNSTCTGKTAVTNGSQVLTFTSAQSGQLQSANFTLNTAYKNLVAIMRECTTSGCTAFSGTPACSTDAFSVRPLTVQSVVSTETPAGAGNAATNTATTGTPMLKAGSDTFALTATVAGIAGSPNGYNGILKINNYGNDTVYPERNGIVAVAPATVAGSVGSTFPGATSGTATAVATGTAFTYSEVGAFRLLGYDPATNTTSARGVFDGVMSTTECAALTAVQCEALRAAAWTGVDGISTKNDCIANSFANTRDTYGTFATNPNYGKFGCNFGLYNPSAPNTPNSPVFGRFIPDHFTVTTARLKGRADLTNCYAATPVGTTGSVDAGSDKLTAASVTGIAVGDILVVFGAGSGGSNLVTAVLSITGSVITLSDKASVKVTNAQVFEFNAMAGTMTAGSALLTLGNASGMAVGDAVVVLGAGTGGGALVSTVSAVAGNVLTLANSAITAVSGAPVFRRAGFTYMGEPMQLDITLEARNAAEGRTRNYVGTLAKLDATSPTGTGANSLGIWGVVGNLYGKNNCRALLDGASPFNTTYSGAGCAGVPPQVPTSPYAAPAARVTAANTTLDPWVAGATALATRVTLERASVPDGAFDFINGAFLVGIRPQDGDGVTPLAGALTLDTDTTAGMDRVAVGAADMRYGRLRLGSGYGSELLPVRLPLVAEMFTVDGTWQRNADDACTPVAVGNVTTSNCQGSLVSQCSGAGGTPNGGTVVPSLTATTLSSGQTTLILSRPACPGTPANCLSGTLDVALNLGTTTTAEVSCNSTHPTALAAGSQPWLRFDWCKGTGDPNAGDPTNDPNARVRFGSPKAPYIYLRERY